MRRAEERDIGIESIGRLRRSMVLAISASAAHLNEMVKFAAFRGASMVRNGLSVSLSATALVLGVGPMLPVMAASLLGVLISAGYGVVAPVLLWASGVLGLTGLVLGFGPIVFSRRPVEIGLPVVLMVLCGLPAALLVMAGYIISPDVRWIRPPLIIDIVAGATLIFWAARFHLRETRRSRNAGCRRTPSDDDAIVSRRI